MISDLLGGMLLGFSLGWLAKAWYYKRSFLLRTAREWFADPRVQRQEKIPPAALVVWMESGEDDDANVPWWAP